VDKNESWHLSKSVPLTLIFAIVGQTFALVWYVSSLNSNVETNMKDIARHEIRLEKLEETTKELSILNARIDENIKAIREMMEDGRGQ
jgi:hypothetical protein